MTDLLDGILAVLIAAILNLFIVSRVGRGYPDTESRGLRKLYWRALLLRAAGAILLNIFLTNASFAAYFWGDSSTYDDAAYYQYLTWTGDLAVNPYSMASMTAFGFVNFIAAIYWVFGRNQLLVQLVNATIGSLSVLVIYALARRLFGPAAARRAAQFMAYFPQMVFWCCGIYKDPAILLCIALSIYAVQRLREKMTFSHVLLYLAATLALIGLRFYIFYMVAFATLGTFLLTQRRGLLSSLMTQTLLGLVFATALIVGVRRETVAQQTSYFDLDRVQHARAGQIMVGQSQFGAQFDVSTPAGAIAAIPVGLVYILFAPFPWAISGVRQLLTVPEMLYWYALMPALIRGLRYAMRHHFRDVLPIVTFAAILLVAYSVFQSNTGTAYRQRTQISMFFFVFMGLGLELKKGARQREPAIALPQAATAARR